MAKQEKEANKSEKPEEKHEEHASSEGGGWGAFPGGMGISFDTVRDATRDMRRQMEDGFMSLVPPEVTGHLVQAQKELILAGRRLGEKTIEELEKKARRAEEIHSRKDASRKAAKGDGESGEKAG